jgi:ABC-type oligopeptide transport system substrate-binding subunit
MTDKRLEIPRRTIIGLAPIAFVGCQSRSGEYFGRIVPPSEQRLVLENPFEPETLDPPLSSGAEANIIHALFEGLTAYHPRTLEPMAALATHYDADASNMQFTFYLRGHPEPRGRKLPNTVTLYQEFRDGRSSQDFSRGFAVPADTCPARWSDGRIVTAHDITYSWRRAVNPATATRKAFLMSPIRNADAIIAGRARPQDLGIQALDDFTLKVYLETPCPFFLQLTSHESFCVVPAHVIELARSSGRESSWTKPGHIVTNGPFVLQEWRPYDRLVVSKNSRYYESDHVALRQISFLPVTDGATSTNLYKAGQADFMPVEWLPQLLPALQRKRDFRINPAFGACFYIFNTRKPPFDNVFLRYALNMAAEKPRIADFMGCLPASTLIPVCQGYDPPAAIRVSVNGVDRDVLSFDPEGARHMLARAGFTNGVGSDGRRLKVEILLPVAPDTEPIAEILQERWRRILGIEVGLAKQEFNVWLQTLFNGTYSGVSHFNEWGSYVDPVWFLSRFMAGTDSMATGWSDPEFDGMVSAANAVTTPSDRMRMLAKCERHLLSAMPVLPLYRETWRHLEKPYVRGLENNLISARRFKYARIDTNWRPS